MHLLLIAFFFLLSPGYDRVMILPQLSDPLVPEVTASFTSTSDCRLNHSRQQQTTCTRNKGKHGQTKAPNRLEIGVHGGDVGREDGDDGEDGDGGGQEDGRTGRKGARPGASSDPVCTVSSSGRTRLRSPDHCRPALMPTYAPSICRGDVLGRGGACSVSAEWRRAGGAPTHSPRGTLSA